MPPKFTRWATARQLLLLLSLLLAGTARPAAAQKAYALLYNYRASTSVTTFVTAVATFDVATPGTFTSIVPVAGLNPAAEWLVGIDVRPATGQLYALSYSTAGQARLYTLTPTNGVLTAVGPALTLNVSNSSSTSNHTGFSFDPTTDRIRVTSMGRDNYRLNPTTGTLDATDGTLTYASTDVNASQSPSVGVSAYTNSYPGATSTTLYNLDLAYNRLVTQVPANTGTLHTVATLTKPPYPNTFVLSYPIQYVDLVIYYSPAAGTNVGYLSRVVSGVITSSDFFSINLTTGAATPLGQFDNGVPGTPLTIADIAIAPSTAAALATRPTELATGLALYPNPAVSGLTLSFGLPHTARVELVVTDLLGRPVSTLDAGVLPAGTQALHWQRGSQAAGMYLFSLRFDGQPAGTRCAVLAQ